MRRLRLDAPVAMAVSEIEAEFDEHDCKQNALKKSPIHP
jgi:hypothetical protein